MVTASQPSGIAHTQSNYLGWKRYGNHALEYFCEFIGTACLLFCVVGAVAFFTAPNSPPIQILPSLRLRLFCAGTAIGTVGGLLAIWPPGRLSGAHINPAVSLGFWMLGKMHFADMLGYITGQFAGAVLGSLAAQHLLGAMVTEVHVADIQPGPHVTTMQAFWGEAAATFVLTCVIFTLLSDKHLMRFTPALLVPLTAILVCVDGTLSGAGMNPARWFGPAYAVSDWSYFNVYLGGPIVGVIVAIFIRRICSDEHRMPATAKIYHDVNYRSVFRLDSVPTKHRTIQR